MQVDDLPVVSSKKCDQILCEIGLVLFAQATDDGAIQCDPLWILGVGDVDEHVAGVHVRVEEVVIKDLGKEGFDAFVS